MSVEYEIRELRADERDTWLRQRQLHWPDTPIDELSRERDEIVSDPTRNCVLVAATTSNQIIGFSEVSIRDWAEGCCTQPVGYIEAWYVEPEFRRSGIGRKLIEAAERWAMSKGCTEMGSDAELDNKLSQQAHQALGYFEVVRLVLFRKRLTP